MRHDLTDSEAEDFEERAAIVEFDHGWPRPIAEAEARRSVIRARWRNAPYVRGWIQPPATGEARVRGQPAAGGDG